jgi:hypothetical protein
MVGKEPKENIKILTILLDMSNPLNELLQIEEQAKTHFLIFEKEERMNRKLSLYMTIIILLVLLTGTGGQARASTSAAAINRYYTILGAEGIPSVGQGLTTHGARPPLGDYSSTRCLYVNVANAGINDYYVYYPLHLPDGATITAVRAYIADFSSATNAAVYMYKRDWNSTDHGTTFAATLSTDSTTGANQLLVRTGISEVVNNNTTQYFLEFSPNNSADPGQLCIYSLKVTYTYNGTYLPLIEN